MVTKPRISGVTTPSKAPSSLFFSLLSLSSLSYSLNRVPMPKEVPEVPELPAPEGRNGLRAAARLASVID